jgi:hypothetical protein
MRNKLAVFGLVIACAVVAVAGFANLLSLTQHAQAVPDATITISPSELHQKLDVNSLPSQDIADPV